jgi:transposase
MRQDVIMMTQKQLNRVEVIGKVKAGYITAKEAGEALGLSERQVYRLRRKVEDYGPAALTHGNARRTPNNKTPEETIKRIVEIKKTKDYANCNFKHFQEKLAEEYDIEIGYSTLYAILKGGGESPPRTRRRKKQHRRRKRREQAGLLLQIDATPFEWFNGDRAKYALHGAIDDATGQITGLYMTKHECIQGYFEMFRRVFENYGVPMSVYADRHTIFQSPNMKKHELDSSVTMNDTQIGRCLKELAITLIAARSPQAKGRIERLWGTLQGRLPIEFSLNGISSMEDANAFLKTYIYEFNSKFAVEPVKTEKAFRELAPAENLDNILCIKEKRIIDNGGVFSYRNKTFKVIDSENAEPIPAKSKVDVFFSMNSGVRVSYKQSIYDVVRFVPPKIVTKRSINKDDNLTPYIPPENHYWRKPLDDKAYSYGFDPLEEQDEYFETVRMLERMFLGEK